MNVELAAVQVLTKAISGPLKYSYNMFIGKYTIYIYAYMYIIILHNNGFPTSTRFYYLFDIYSKYLQ